MKIDKEKLAKLATVRVYCTQEDIPLRGNVLASGDDAADKEVEEYVRRQLEGGNQWAWCSVEVRASYAGVDGADYLGCVSYESEESFRVDLLPEMTENALAELARELETVAEGLDAVAETEGGAQ